MIVHTHRVLHRKRTGIGFMKIVDCWCKFMRAFVLVLLAILVLLCTGCAGRIVTGSVENRIEDRLPSLIGPAESYDVEVKGSTKRMLRGQIDSVVIFGREVWVLPGLRLDSLNIRMTDVAANPDNGTLKSVGSTEFDADISEQSLNEYLAEIRMDDPKVELLDGELIVRTTRKVLGLSTNVVMTGTLVPEGKKLNFKLRRLKVAGLGTPSIATKVVEDWINPVLDLESTDFSPELESVVISPGSIRVTGEAHLGDGGSPRRADQAN